MGSQLPGTRPHQPLWMWSPRNLQRDFAFTRGAPRSCRQRPRLSGRWGPIGATSRWRSRRRRQIAIDAGARPGVPARTRRRTLSAPAVEADDASSPAHRLHWSGATPAAGSPGKWLRRGPRRHSRYLRRRASRNGSRSVAERLHAAAYVRDPEDNRGHTTPERDHRCALPDCHEFDLSRFIFPSDVDSHHGTSQSSFFGIELPCVA